MNDIAFAEAINVFNSIEDYLDPQQHQSTPCVRISERLTGLDDAIFYIYGKLAFFNPLFQSKFYAADGILTGLAEEGSLEGKHTLDDNSSGNTALGYVALAKTRFGIPNVVMTVPLDMPASKREILELFGCQVIPTTGGIQKSFEMAKQSGWVCGRQYHSKHNVTGFKRTLGTQLWKQLGEHLTVLSAGMGTSGTITGTAAPFREQGHPNFTVVGVTPTVDQVPGTRQKERLKEVGLDWQSAIDHHVEVTVKESYRMSLKLCRQGILGGPSSGLALAGLLQFLHEAKAEGILDRLRNREGKIVAAFVCPDTLLPYLNKYTTHLEPEDLAE